MAAQSACIDSLLSRLASLNMCLDINQVLESRRARQYLIADGAIYSVYVCICMCMGRVRHMTERWVKFSKRHDLMAMVAVNHHYQRLL